MTDKEYKLQQMQIEANKKEELRLALEEYRKKLTEIHQKAEENLKNLTDRYAEENTRIKKVSNHIYLVSSTASSDWGNVFRVLTITKK